MEVGEDAGAEAAQLEVDGGQGALAGGRQVAGGRVDATAPDLEDWRTRVFLR